MADSPASYIHMVHHLIEECIVFNMSKEECMEALSKHANILPAITSTVWNELEKENKEFFEAYTTTRDHQSASSVANSTINNTTQTLHNLFLDSSTPNDRNQQTS